MIHGKIWGRTSSLLVTPFIEIHHILIDPYSYCSMHKHEHKNNAFYVISGRLNIITRKNDYALEDVTELNGGDFTTVNAGEFHKFESFDEEVSALEIYYLDPLNPKDILRENVGGVLR